MLDGRPIDQEDVEQQFYRTFKSVLNPSPKNKYVISYSVSSLAYAVGFLLRRFTTRIIYQSPFFDNMRDIVRRCGCTVTNVDEKELFNSPEKYIQSQSAVWLTIPNNPSGYVPQYPDLIRLADRCESTRVPLVIDVSFRAFSKKMEALDIPNSFQSFKNLSWILLEDTGKMLPLSDIKVGLAECSSDLYPFLNTLNEEHMLNASPIILETLACALSRFDVDSDLRAVVELNRATLAHLDGWQAADAQIISQGDAPFIWAKGPRGFGAMLMQRLRQRGVGVLEGSRFFDEAYANGASFVRIALSRSPDIVSRAAPLIDQTLHDVAHDDGR